MEAIFQLEESEVSCLLENGFVTNVRTFPLAKSLQRALFHQYATTIGSPKGISVGVSKILGFSDLLNHWDDLLGFIPPKAGSFILKFNLTEPANYINLEDLFATNSKSIVLENECRDKLKKFREQEIGVVSKKYHKLKLPLVSLDSDVTLDSNCENYSEAIITEQLNLEDLCNDGFLMIKDNWETEFIKCSDSSSSQIDKLHYFTQKEG